MRRAASVIQREFNRLHLQSGSPAHTARVHLLPGDVKSRWPHGVYVTLLKILKLSDFDRQPFGCDTGPDSLGLDSSVVNYQVSHSLVRGIGRRRGGESLVVVRTHRGHGWGRRRDRSKGSRLGGGGASAQHEDECEGNCLRQKRAGMWAHAVTVRHRAVAWGSYPQAI